MMSHKTFFTVFTFIMITIPVTIVMVIPLEGIKPMIALAAFLQILTFFVHLPVLKNFYTSLDELENKIRYHERSEKYYDSLTQELSSRAFHKTIITQEELKKVNERIEQE